MRLTDSSGNVYVNISIWLQQTNLPKRGSGQLGRMRNSEEKGTLYGSGKLREITPCFPRGLKFPYTLIKQAMEGEEETCPVEAFFGSNRRPRSQYICCVCVRASGTILSTRPTVLQCQAPLSKSLSSFLIPFLFMFQEV